MPRLSCLIASEIAPIARIDPEIEKNHRLAPLKSKCQLTRRSRGAQRARRVQDAASGRASPRTACVNSTAVNSETIVPMPEREREALDARGREHEEDERREQRDHVRVDDRRDALAVALRDRGQHRSPGPRLLLYSLEDDDVGVGRHPDRQDQPGDPRQGQRDRDQLDQGEEEEPVDDQPEHGDQPRAGGSRGAGTGPRPARPIDARLEPLVERLLAERRRDGALADQRELDRQRADLQERWRGPAPTPIVKLPEIWAPGAAVDPVGLSTKLMIGLETIWLSRTIAKCCEYWSADGRAERPRRRGGVARAGRSSGSRPGTPSCPVSVKSKVTFGWLVVGSKFCFGLVISVPGGPGWSLSTNCGDSWRAPPGLGEGVAGRRSGCRDHDRSLRHRDDLGVRAAACRFGVLRNRSFVRLGRPGDAACASSRRTGSRSARWSVHLFLTHSGFLLRGELDRVVEVGEARRRSGWGRRGWPDPSGRPAAGGGMTFASKS